MEKKKILFVIPSLSQTNGVASFLMNYIQNLDLDKIEITILTSDIRPSEFYLKILKKLEIYVCMIPYIKKSGFIKYLNGLNKFFKENSNFDLIYLNLINQSLFIVPIAKKYGNSNFAMHSHATTSSESKLKRLLNDLVIKIMINKFNYLFSCSTEAGKAMFGNKEFNVIRNAINYEKFMFSKKNRNETRRELLLSENIKLIGFVGRFSKQKNIYLFIELAKKLSEEYKILMIGTGNFKNDFIRKIDIENVKEKFIFIDECSDVYKYYSAMDIFLLPSHYEGLPVVAIEAQVNGLYTLLSDSISKETKISANTYFFDRKNIDEIYKLVKHVEKRNENKISDLYNIKIQSQEFEKKLMNISKNERNKKCY